MTEAEFRPKRRQKFLTSRHFQLNRQDIQSRLGAIADGAAADRQRGVVDPSNEGAAFKEHLKLLRLLYTAGEPIETLRPVYRNVTHWLAEWHRAETAYAIQLAKRRGEDLRTDMTPVAFGDLFHFQLALDVVSLGILLGDGDAIRHAAALMHSARHSDMLFETLIEEAVSDPDMTVSEFFHSVPYDPLLDAVYSAKSPEAAVAFLRKYLDGWYAGFKGVPWHDGHLVQTDEYSNYEGYWAFEAAAICVLKGIDDTSFRDHLVYPKDLADWARRNHSLDSIKPGTSRAFISAENGGLRCEAGQPCPREGYWQTPAKVGSRQHFQLGQVMPEAGGDYGATIWQWDVDQGER
jgi:hypothetical protein